MLVTRASAKLVMAAGMTLVGAGILWATQVPVHGQLLGQPRRPVLRRRGRHLGVHPGVDWSAGRCQRSTTPGSPPGCSTPSQQIGGAIGVAVASTVAAAHSRDLLGQGHAAAAALTGGFQWAFWVSGLTGLAAVPVTLLLVRRAELARAVAAAQQREPVATAAGVTARRDA